jgi:hypothetical protein
LVTNIDKAWLYIATIPMLHEKGEDSGTLELVLHFIPETVAVYMGKRNSMLLKQNSRKN